VLENGGIVLDGNVESAVSYYLGGNNIKALNKATFGDEYDKDIFQLHEIKLKNVGNMDNEPIVEDKAIELVTDITFKTDIPARYRLTFHITNELGDTMFSFYDKNNQVAIIQGRNLVKCIIPKDFFQSGNFSLTLFIVEDKRRSVFSERDIVSFTVVDGNREIGVYMGREPGYITPTFNWEN